MLGEDVAVACTQNAGGEGAEVWDEDEAEGAWLENGCGFFEEGTRVNEVFGDGPKGHCVEGFCETLFEEIAAADGNGLLFGVVEGRAGDIGSQNFVLGGEARFKLVEKCAGGTSDIEDASACNVAGEEAEFAFETHRRIVASEFIFG